MTDKIRVDLTDDELRFVLRLLGHHVLSDGQGGAIHTAFDGAYTAMADAWDLRHGNRCKSYHLPVLANVQVDAKPYLDGPVRPMIRVLDHAPNVRDLKEGALHG